MVVIPSAARDLGVERCLTSRSLASLEMTVVGNRVQISQSVLLRRGRTGRDRNRHELFHQVAGLGVEQADLAVESAGCDASAVGRVRDRVDGAVMAGKGEQPLAVLRVV